MSNYRSIEWKDGNVRMLDQRLLPLQVNYLDFNTCQGVAKAIRDMIIRGAPAIGAAAAYGLVLAVRESAAKDRKALLADLDVAAETLRQARPTAVNLFWAIERVLESARSEDQTSVGKISQAVLAEADEIYREDAEMCKRMGMHGMEVTPQGDVTFIHHCNTGALATVDYGSALGVIRTAHEQGRDVFVYVDETRPRLQGARLTSWELKELGIRHALIADGASGFVMRNRKVDLVTVGSDRIAANGDVANKIGTYNLAVVANHNNVPFYAVAPTSTIDLSTKDGRQIEIEERDKNEIIFVGKEQIAPDGTEVFNPAFDVTPAELISGIITEEGIARPPYEKSLAEMVERAQSRRAKARSSG